MSRKEVFLLIGNLLSIPGDIALALSVVLRIRELGCRIPGLLVWPIVEGRYLLEKADSYTEIRSGIEERLGKQIEFI